MHNVLIICICRVFIETPTHENTPTENGLADLPPPLALPPSDVECSRDKTAASASTAQPTAVEPARSENTNNFTFTVPPSPPPIPPPEAIVCIAHAFACPAADYTKKPNVFRLKTKDGKEFLLQVK